MKGENVMKISEAARHLAVHPETLRKWEKAGLITSEKTPCGHRIFTAEQILRIQEVIRMRSMERKKS